MAKVIARVPPVFSAGEGKKFAVFRLADVGTGDSYDLGPEFARVDHADACAVSAADPTLTLAIVGTVVTMTGAQLAKDIVYLSACGASD
jgi:hypothetical protein